MPTKSVHIPVLFAAAAALVVSLPPQDACARDGAGHKRRADLVRPPRALDVDAHGAMRLKVGRRTDRLTIRLRELEGSAEYELRDADTAGLLGSVVADSRGRAKLRVRIRHQAMTETPSKMLRTPTVRSVAVYRAGTDSMVLVGGLADGGLPDDAEVGEAFYGDASAPNASVVLFHDGSGHDVLYVSLCANTDPGAANLFRLWADNLGGGELPLGVDGVDQLSGRRFDVIDRDDREVLSGVLPALRPIDDPDGGLVIAPAARPVVGDGPLFAAPLRMRIADAEDELVSGGEFARVDHGLPGDPRTAWKAFGDGDAVRGSVALFSGEAFESLVVSLGVGPEDESAAGIVWYQYTAAGSRGRADLPFGVGDIDGLVGRRFEVRAGSGDTIGAGTLPPLTEAPGDGGSDAVSTVTTTVTGPFTLWLSDDDGTLVSVGELTSDGGMFAVPGATSGTSVFGDLAGTFGMVVLESAAGAREVLSVVLGITQAGNLFDADLYALRIDTTEGDELPLGLSVAGDLAGRAFAIRNASGATIVQDALPQLGSGGSLPFPGAPQQPSEGPIDAGTGPFTLWIADDDAILRQVGELGAADVALPMGRLPALR